VATVKDNFSEVDKTGINGNDISPSGTAGSCRSRAAAGAPLGSAIFSEFAWQSISRSLNLSARELQIVRAVFDDDKETRIAAGLDISAHTVHALTRHLYAKLKLSGRPQLILCLVREFLALSGSGRNLPPICPAHQSGKCLLASSWSEEPESPRDSPRASKRNPMRRSANAPG